MTTKQGTGGAHRFAWYGRLSTKDKQDPTLSFPSQRRECETKVAELGGRIVSTSPIRSGDDATIGLAGAT